MSGGVPAGWVLVPVEPTLEMYEAGYDATRLADGTPQFANAGFCIGHSGNIYRAMLAATPTPPIEGRDADVERENMRWFSDQRRLSLDFYSPMYCDDDDQSEEWRVTKESGPINDREWDVIGRGQTIFEAVASARAALQALGELP